MALNYEGDFDGLGIEAFDEIFGSEDSDEGFLSFVVPFSSEDEEETEIEENGVDQFCASYFNSLNYHFTCDFAGKPSGEFSLQIDKGGF